MAFWNCGIDSDVREVLTQVEEQEPIWVIRQSADTWGLAPLVHASAQVQEWALTDTGPWAINMTFTRHTEDGELDIAVYSSPNQASVSVTLKLNADARIVELASYTYITSLNGGHPAGRRVNRAAVRHVREWVRRRSLPELEAAKARRTSALARQAAELDALRRKHLP